VQAGSNVKQAVGPKATKKIVKYVFKVTRIRWQILQVANNMGGQLGEILPGEV